MNQPNLGLYRPPSSQSVWARVRETDRPGGEKKKIDRHICERVETEFGREEEKKKRRKPWKKRRAKMINLADFGLINSSRVLKGSKQPLSSSRSAGPM